MGLGVHPKGQVGDDSPLCPEGALRYQHTGGYLVSSQRASHQTQHQAAV